MKKPELLLPAGDMSTLKIAYKYGADACYVGGEEFSLRAKATNFSNDDLKSAVEYAHSINKKIYITANIYAHNSDIRDAKEYFEFLNKIMPDGILISDIGLFSLAKKICKNIDLHISTQANTTNYESVLFYKELGAKRVVLARELSLAEIKQIREKVEDSIELEAFVHGAMCISYSGRCLLSSYFTGRSANSGLCTHPCRWKYVEADEQQLAESGTCRGENITRRGEHCEPAHPSLDKTFVGANTSPVGASTASPQNNSQTNYEISTNLIETERPNDILPVIENERGTYIFNSKDLSMIEHIDDLVKANIDSLKIEGRMKSELYIATVARCYRYAIDKYFENEEEYKNSINNLLEEIKKCTYRGFTTGFFYHKPNEETQVYDSNTYINGATFYGIIEKVDDEGYAYITQKNKFQVGEVLELMDLNLSNIELKVLKMIDVDTNAELQSCPHSKQKLKIKFDKNVKEGLVLRSR